MYKFLTKNGQMLAFGVGAVLSLLFYLIAYGGMEEFNALAEEEKATASNFNFGLAVAIGLTIIGFALTIIFGIIQTATHPKGALKGIVVLVALVVIFFITYSMADGTVKTIWAEEFDVTEGVSKYVSAAITTTIIMGVIAILAFVVGEVRNFFK